MEIVRQGVDAMNRRDADAFLDGTDDRVFLALRFAARGSGGGAETELHVWPILWFVDGKIQRRQVFRERAEALEAAGLEE